MRLSFFLVLLLLVTVSGPATAAEQNFTRFSVTLPEGWTGDERTGLSGRDTDEYMLTLMRKDTAEERILAQVSVFLLPNPNGDTAEAFAQKLAALQQNAAAPRREGQFMVFEGEPAGRVFKAPAVTRVNVTPARALIIIAQDPDKTAATDIVQSLKGLTPEARELLGR